MLTVKATVLKFLYSSDDYKIMACVLDEENENILLNGWGNFTVTGSAPWITEGKTYEMTIEPTTHPKYGMQYKLLKLPQYEDINIDSLTPEQEYDLLLSITTPQQARNINSVYPNFVKLILREEDDKIDLKKIYNVGEVYFNLYKEKIKKEFAFLIITSSYPDFQLSKDEVKVLLQLCNQDTNKVKEWLDTIPYTCLCIYNHRGFDVVDKLLKKLRPDLLDSEQRCIALACYIIRDNESYGNTRMSARDMAIVVADTAPELLNQLRPFVEQSEFIHFDEDTNTVANNNTYSAESFTAYTLKRLLKDPIKWDIDWQQYKNTLGFELTNEQLELLHLICENNIVLLQGWGGTGKSSSVQALITMLEDNHLTYTLLAPTGIASKVLSETTGRKAHTIHRMLGRGGEIDTDIVIIDELSMLGVEHMGMICPALCGDTKVILIGDNAQLASIACGNIIHDIQAWGNIPTVNLTTVFRYGKGGIATVATDTRNEKEFLSDAGEVLFEADNQYTFLPASDEPLQQVVDEYGKLIDSGYSKDEILILVPFNVGDYGTYAINQEIQSHYNAHKENPFIPTHNTRDNKFTISFLVGDRVLNTKNHYEMEVYHDFDNTEEIGQNHTDIFNGDIGVVRKTDEDYMIVEIDETLVKIGKSQGSEFLLGNAVSIHKIQGGAAKAIILLTTNHHKRMLTNNLLYVALTRAKEKVIHIGDVSAINNSLYIHETENRDTWLYDMLKGGDCD